MGAGVWTRRWLLSGLFHGPSSACLAADRPAEPGCFQWGWEQAVLLPREGCCAMPCRARRSAGALGCSGAAGCVLPLRGDRSMPHRQRAGGQAPSQEPAPYLGPITGWERAGVTSREGTCCSGVSSECLEPVVWLQPRGRSGPLPFELVLSHPTTRGGFSRLREELGHICPRRGDPRGVPQPSSSLSVPIVASSPSMPRLIKQRKKEEYGKELIPKAIIVNY